MHLAFLYVISGTFVCRVAEPCKNVCYPRGGTGRGGLRTAVVSKTFARDRRKIGGCGCVNGWVREVGCYLPLEVKQVPEIAEKLVGVGGCG